jgi:hypothetical protein
MPVGDHGARLLEPVLTCCMTRGENGMAQAKIEGGFEMSEKSDEFAKQVETVVRDFEASLSEREWSMRRDPKRMRDETGNVFSVLSLTLINGASPTSAGPERIRHPRSRRRHGPLPVATVRRRRNSLSRGRRVVYSITVSGRARRHRQSDEMDSFAPHQRLDQQHAGVDRRTCRTFCLNLQRSRAPDGVVCHDRSTRK